jgi:hypothetical protein
LNVFKRILVVILGACLGASAPAAAAPFLEVGDAGNLPGTALTTDVSGLDAILGNLSAQDPFDAVLDVDMYLLYITDPGGFSASTVGATGFNVEDPQLFLFTSTGAGVFMNDDDPSGLNGSQSALGALPLGFTPGFYFLAIGWFDNEPLSAIGALLFDASTGLAAGPDPVVSWNNDVTLRLDVPTAYQINLAGAVSAVPEPSTMTLTALGLAALVRRLRQRARGPGVARHSHESAGA